MGAMATVIIARMTTDEGIISISRATAMIIATTILVRTMLAMAAVQPRQLLARLLLLLLLPVPVAEGADGGKGNEEVGQLQAPPPCHLPLLRVASPQNHPRRSSLEVAGGSRRRRHAGLRGRPLPHPRMQRREPNSKQRAVAFFSYRPRGASYSVFRLTACRVQQKPSARITSQR